MRRQRRSLGDANNIPTVFRYDTGAQYSYERRAEANFSVSIQGQTTEEVTRSVVDHLSRIGDEPALKLRHFTQLVNGISRDQFMMIVVDIMNPAYRGLSDVRDELVQTYPDNPFLLQFARYTNELNDVARNRNRFSPVNGHINSNLTSEFSRRETTLHTELQKQLNDQLGAISREDNPESRIRLTEVGMESRRQWLPPPPTIEQLEDDEQKEEYFTDVELRSRERVDDQVNEGVTEERDRVNTSQITYMKDGRIYRLPPGRELSEGERGLSLSENTAIRWRQINQMPPGTERDEAETQLRADFIAALQQENPGLSDERANEVYEQYKNDPRLQKDVIETRAFIQAARRADPADIQAMYKALQEGNSAAFRSIASKYALEGEDEFLMELLEGSEELEEEIAQAEQEEAEADSENLLESIALSAEAINAIENQASTEENIGFVDAFREHVFAESSDAVFSLMNGMVVRLPKDPTETPSVFDQPMDTFGADGFDEAAAAHLQANEGVELASTEELHTFLEAGGIQLEDNEMMTEGDLKKIVSYFTVLGMNTDADNSWQRLQNMNLLGSDESFEPTKLARVFVTLESWGVGETDAGVTPEDIERLAAHWQNGNSDIPSLFDVRNSDEFTA